ncbi:hypothetical protein ACXR2T_10140 [Leucobacter sp. HY1910]
MNTQLTDSRPLYRVEVRRPGGLGVTHYLVRSETADSARTAAARRAPAGALIGGAHAAQT